MNAKIHLVVFAVASTLLGQFCLGFIPQARLAFKVKPNRDAKSSSKYAAAVDVSSSSASSHPASDVLNVVDNNLIEEEVTTAVRAPLKYIGPYPCLALRFPHLATASQRARNVTGISLDFVLDTAANTNTINGQVAKELDLEVVGHSLPGLGAGGAIAGADTFLLGDAQLDGLWGEPFTFMSDLSASALPVASPAAAGLLSLAFFHCFSGVEFQWNLQQQENVTIPPSVTFLCDDHDFDKISSEVTRVPIQTLPVTNLYTVTIDINGIQMPALLDTGSPITVLNEQAAIAAGVKTVELPTKNSNNPFAAFVDNIKNAEATAEAAARGDVLMIAGTNGQIVNLLKSTTPVPISLAGDSDNKVNFDTGYVYVGELPGLAAMNGLGIDSPPAVVLGMDVLRKRPRMILRAQVPEVYF